MFAAVIQARTGSQRCKNKMLRDFAGTNLITIALEKYSRPSELYNLYYAVYEQELLEAGKGFPCTVLRRGEESANSEQIEVIMNYLAEMKEKYVVFINACCPFLRKETVEAAIIRFKETSARSMTAVVKTHTWYYHKDGTPINFLDPTNLNTKFSESLLAVTHCIHIFDRERFLDKHYFWSHEERDPVFFEMPHAEAIDIDTELEFEMAEALYRARGHGRASTSQHKTLESEHV